LVRVEAPIVPDRVSEYPGSGLEALIGTAVYRLGRSEWTLAEGESLQSGAEMASVILSKDGRCLAAFQFEDRLRSDAREAVAILVKDGLTVEVLSGDREQPVWQLASAFGVSHRSQVSPGGKVAHIAASGRKVLMVGDGLNDGPALVAAHASMAPASAAESAATPPIWCFCARAY
jgi:Cu2+-exporting ATPase